MLLYNPLTNIEYNCNYSSSDQEPQIISQISSQDLLKNTFYYYIIALLTIEVDSHVFYHLINKERYFFDLKVLQLHFD